MAGGKETGRQKMVGMMYLVDLDDTPGYTLKITQQEEKKEEKKDGKKDEPVKPSPEAPVPTMTASELEGEAQKIIEEAKAKLEALARGERRPTNKLTSQGLLACSCGTTYSLLCLFCHTYATLTS